MDALDLPFVIGERESRQLLYFLQGRYQGFAPQLQVDKDLADVLSPGVTGAQQLHTAKKNKDDEEADTHTVLQSFFGLAKQFPAPRFQAGPPKH